MRFEGYRDPPIGYQYRLDIHAPMHKPYARPWPDPYPAQLESPEFNAIWECIKNWDINVPDVYHGHCDATGNHVRAILDALANVHFELVFQR